VGSGFFPASQTVAACNGLLFCSFLHVTSPLAEVGLQR